MSDYIPGVFDPMDYGAVGDGNNDDTSAINAAITAAQAGCSYPGTGCGSVYVPAGIYKVSQEISICNNIKFSGAGVNSTMFRPAVGFSGTLFYVNGNSNQGCSPLIFPEFSDLKIDTTSSLNSSNVWPLVIASATGAKIHDLIIGGGY